MKIIDITIRKEPMSNGEIGLACWVGLDDGTHIAAAGPWRNKLGLWASDSDAREPAEIAATLRQFAKAIEEACLKAEAA